MTRHEVSSYVAMASAPASIAALFASGPWAFAATWFLGLMCMWHVLDGEEISGAGPSL